MKRPARIAAVAAAIVLVVIAARAVRRWSAPAPTSEPGARGLAVAAAADLRFALDELRERFGRERPDIQVRPTYGSSGHFYAQLLNRAPFDLFLSADRQYPRRLAERGLTVAGSEFTYAVGRIVLWTPAASPLDVQRLGMNAVLDSAVAHLAVANPEHAPYGRAAIAALASFDLLDRVRQKLVYGENVAQTLQFVQSGAAEAGLVALSLALAPPVRDTGRYWAVPLDAYPTIWQGGAILKWARDVEAARAFRRFLLSDAGRAALQRYGFSIPE